MTYIICEIGQNHCGDFNLAKQMIEVAVTSRIYDPVFDREFKGIDAVKFVKRDMSEELSNKQFNSIYANKHSYAPIYGDHRRKLELSYEQHIELADYTRSFGIDFIDTLCSPKTLQLAQYVDKIKIASRDLVNPPLLELIAQCHKPTILSTGMSGVHDIQIAIAALKTVPELTLLHCLSQYPANYQYLDLKSVSSLKRIFPELDYIGYSDHSIGILAPSVAVALGAEVIEKHFTLDREAKGSDHKGAVEPEGLVRMVRNIRLTELMMGEGHIEKPIVIQEKLQILGRSLAVNRHCAANYELKSEDFCMLSPGNGLKWQEKEFFIGKKLLKQTFANTLLSKNMVKG